MAPPPKIPPPVAEEVVLFPNMTPEGAAVAGVVLAPAPNKGAPAAGVVDVVVLLFPNRPPAGVELPPAVLEAAPKSEGPVVEVVLAPPNSPPGFDVSVGLAPNKPPAGWVEFAAGVPKAEEAPKRPPDVAVVAGWPEAALELGVPKSPDMAAIM